MAKIKVYCPNCRKAEVVKAGFSSSEKQRYKCNFKDCSRVIFILSYSRNGELPEVKQKIIDMALNGSGIRDTARVLKVSMNTVMSTLKKNINL